MEKNKDIKAVTGTELIIDIVRSSIQLAFKQGKENGSGIKCITVIAQFGDGGSSKVDVNVDP